MTLSPVSRLSGPVQFVVRLMSVWRLTASDAGRLMGLGDDDISYVKDILRGAVLPCDRDFQYRIAYLFRVRAILSKLFYDVDVENQWLREPHEPLGGRNPLALMQGSLEEVLLAREYAEMFAGR